MNKIQKFIAVFFCSVCSVYVAAQTVLSPYSTFAVGNMIKDGQSTIRALGGTPNAYRDFTVVNYCNPASYTAFDTLSFVFDVSLDINSLRLETASNTTSNTYAGFGGLNVGFPITKRVKIGAGLLPFSNVGYDITDNISDANVGYTKYNFLGNGGVNNAFVGVGVQLGDFSLGGNLSYLFGTINQSYALMYPDSAFFYNTKILNESYIRSFYANFGVQYNAKLNEDTYLCLGASYFPQIRLKSDESVAVYNYSALNDIEKIVDTVYTNKVTSGILMPQKLGMGVMLRKLNRYRLLLDFNWQQWSKFENADVAQDMLHDSYRGAVGFEYSPRNSTSSNYFKWMKYRVGAYFEKTPLFVFNHDIYEFGITFGLCFPIIRSASTVNVALNVGNRGTRSDNLIKETYITTTVSFSLYDTWFYRIKYK